MSKNRSAVGGKLQIQVFSADAPGAEAAIDAAFAEIDRIELLFSDARPDSDIGRLNRSAGAPEPVVVAPETMAVLVRGKQISALTGGAFSITWAALASLWTFEPGTKTIPDPMKAVQKASLIDDSQVELDPGKGTVRLGRPGMAVGVGALGEGYALDRALIVLKERGYPNALVFVGGDLIAGGAKGERPWVVGIQDPRAAGYFATLSVTDEAVATSGDYEKYFEVGGTRYHHILDPRSGFPAANGSRSVTVVAKDAVTADAFATAIFILGPVEGMKLVEAQPGIGAVIVDKNNVISVSPSLKDRVRVLREPTGG